MHASSYVALSKLHLSLGTSGMMEKKKEVQSIRPYHERSLLVSNCRYYTLHQFTLRVSDCNRSLVLQLPLTKNVIRKRRQNCPPGLQFFLPICSILNFDKLGHYSHWSFCLSWRRMQYLIKKIPLLLTWIFQRRVSLPQNQAISPIPVHTFSFRLLLHEVTLSGNSGKTAIFIYITLDVFVGLWLYLFSFPIWIAINAIVWGYRKYALVTCRGLKVLDFFFPFNVKKGSLVHERKLPSLQ